MTNHTPETLKRIAEMAGYEAWLSGVPQQSGQVMAKKIEGDFTGFIKIGSVYRYDPLTNAEQSMELLKVLLSKGCSITQDDERDCLYWVWENHWMDGAHGYDESLETAILNAMADFVGSFDETPLVSVIDTKGEE